MKNIGFAGIIVLMLLFSCKQQPSIDHNAYMKEMDQWHADTAEPAEG